MEKDIQVLVIDDHQVVREGLRRLLGDEKDIQLVGQGANSEEALVQIEMLSPDIVLMDIKMPGVDGISLTKQLKEKYPCNIIMLTLYDEYLTQAMEAGARGYLLKDIKREELAQAIRRVYHGEVVVSDSITSKLRNEYEEQPDEETGEISDGTFEEVQLVLPPPVEANQLMRFASHVEDMLQSRVLQVVGSWQDGTIMTITLDRAMPSVDILNRLEGITEVETIGEEPLIEESSSKFLKISPKLLKQTKALPRLQNRPRKTIFVILESAYTGDATIFPPLASR